MPRQVKQYRPHREEVALDHQVRLHLISSRNAAGIRFTKKGKPILLYKNGSVNQDVVKIQNAPHLNQLSRQRQIIFRRMLAESVNGKITMGRVKA